MLRLLVLFAFALFLASVAACGGDGGSDSPTATPQATPCF